MKKLILITLVILAAIYTVFYYTNPPAMLGEKEAVYSSGSIQQPRLSMFLSDYTYIPETYNNPEYELPLTELPENYQRDLVERFGNNLSEEQIQILLDNGAIILQGNEYNRFEHAYSNLNQKDIPVFITSDSILHLFHLEFNEILKNLEIKKLSPMLKEFLKSLIKESMRQYNGFEDGELKELSKRNIAYLSVAMKLLDPNYVVTYFVSDDVNKELDRIEKHEGFFKSEIMSKDCPDECLRLAFPKWEDEKCSQEIKGGKIFYQNKEWDSVEFYSEICTRECYCEDYSQYIPRGHYTSSEGLKQYFKSMMWLGRITFKTRGESWTKQAILLTDAVKSAEVKFEGKTYPASEIYNKIYSITSFFAGVSDDLTFYDYDEAIKKVYGYEFNEEDTLTINVAKKIQKELNNSEGPKILGGFEIDLAGNLKELTQGLRLIGQRYAIDSQILGDLVYKNVGPNVKSPYYQKVINCESTYSKLSKPKGFYITCAYMDENKTKYWNEVCSKATEMYIFGFCGGLNESQLYSVCRFMPTGLDVVNILGSEKAEQVLNEYYNNGYCGYDKKQYELRTLVDSYSEEMWTKNLYNTWLWMLQPVLKEKPEGYPNWMKSETWRLKDLITSLSSWAELRHDTILYVKQSYTWATAMAITSMPIEAKYYGYVEPNPELFARAKYAIDFLKQGLSEQEVITEEVKSSLEQSSEMMEKLRIISEKELKGENLTEEDFDYIKSIDSKFNSILEDLASALKIESGGCPVGKQCEKKISLEGKDEAFKTSMIADVHTDSNTKKVLEVGTGKVDWIVVAHKSKDGRIGIAIGPIFSYYEFAWPMDDRLTDEKWRGEILSSTERPVLYKEINLSSVEGVIVK
ncbi:MAG: DUF3160 domain-containing protein [Candidatus Aenigmarchaeota archaeon]|nr:DUF3160 domain-containing protein [Candidatus Aenigmarchaeota archaeon]